MLIENVAFHTVQILTYHTKDILILIFKKRRIIYYLQFKRRYIYFNLKQKQSNKLDCNFVTFLATFLILETNQMLVTASRT